MNLDAPPRNLVIGAAGQVGTQMMRVLSGERVLPTSRVVCEPGWIAVDLARGAAVGREVAEIVDREHIDVVYCVGGATDVEGCERDPATASAVNCDAPAAIAAATKKRGARFVYFSTDYVFDGEGGPYDEMAPPNPLNAYGKSKLSGERAVFEEQPESLILRTTVVYGDDRRGRNFVHALSRALRARQVFRAAFDQLSTPTYNRDLAEAAVALVRHGANGIWNVVGPEVLSRYEFAVRVAGSLQLDTSLISAVPTAELGQVARRPLRAGLRIDKLRAVAPRVRMRTVEEALNDGALAGARP